MRSRVSRSRLHLLAAPLGLAVAARAQARGDAGHGRFVERAYANRERAVAAGDQPYGAVLVCGSEIVADGVSAVVTARDPTAHAEMQALRAAMTRLGRSDLAGCVLYGTSRACAMCESAAAQAGVERLYYGRDAAGGEKPRQR